MVVFRISFLAVLLGLSPVVKSQVDFTILAYHDVVPNKSALYGDAVTAETLVNHFEWLLSRGYQPVSLQQILDHKAGTKSLPPKAVLLTFDDGYASVYTRVYPLLKQYRFPAAIALVGEFMETDKDSVQYTRDQKLPRNAFLQWDQVREMQSSGWVEVCSHSYGLHHEMPSNEQGNLLPAATTFFYDSTKKRNESIAEYAQRLRLDLVKSRKTIFNETGQYPLAVVWPYGRYNDLTNRLALEAGYKATLNLNSQPNLMDADPTNINRYYITYNANTDALRNFLNQRTAEPVYRFLAPGLPILIGDDRDSAEILLSALVRQASISRPNAIIIPLFYPSKDLGWQTYFPNAELSYQNTNMNRLIWQMQSRAGTEAFLHWDVSTWSTILPTRDKQYAFFGALGKEAPATGVVLKDSALMEWLWRQSHTTSLDFSRMERRKARQALLEQNRNTDAGTGLAALSVFEFFQANQKVFLQASLKQSQWMRDTAFSRLALTTFNGVLFDLSQLPSAKILTWLRNLRLTPQWYGRVGLLLPPTSTTASKKINQLLLTQKIIHWGYVIDSLDDIYKWKLPINTSMTRD